VPEWPQSAAPCPSAPYGSIWTLVPACHSPGRVPRPARGKSRRPQSATQFDSESAPPFLLDLGTAGSLPWLRASPRAVARFTAPDGGLPLAWDNVGGEPAPRAQTPPDRTPPDRTARPSRSGILCQAWRRQAGSQGRHGSVPLAGGRARVVQAADMRCGPAMRCGYTMRSRSEARGQSGGLGYATRICGPAG
jgi:hypothetical protein